MRSSRLEFFLDKGWIGSMTRHTILKRTRISRDPSRLPGIVRPLWHEPSNCVIIFSPIFYFFLVTRGQMVFFSPPNNRKKMTLIQIFFYILVQKNALSSSYNLRFEYQLHRYILYDETNKTRSHLHII